MSESRATETKDSHERTRRGSLPELVSVREAATLLGISESKAYELIQTGDLKAYKTGRIRVPISSIWEYLETTAITT